MSPQPINAPSNQPLVPATRESFWRQAIAEWTRSGLSQVEFCQARGISAGTFAWWKRETRRRDRDQQSKGTGSALTLASSKRFVPVELVTSGRSALASGAVEIILGGSRRLHVGRGFDPEVLRDVVRVLEALPC